MKTGWNRLPAAAAGLAAGLASLLLTGGCNQPAEPSPRAAGITGGEPSLDSFFSPAPAVAQNDSTAAGPPTGNPPASGSSGNDAKPPRPLNAQAVDKIIEDNITMREEIRRLRIERENLIRLLRAMGENYEPSDPDKKDK